MINYTSFCVNLYSFFLTIIIFFIIQLFSYQTQSFVLNKREKPITNCYTEKQVQTEKTVVEKTTTKPKKQNKEGNNNEWKIVIPSIGLEAPIAEGTSQKVMSQYVGHFENTPKLNGNVALGAHNRGYSVNYFQDLKKLKKGDKIQYYYYGETKQYRVETITIIKDTDWTYLQNTTKDKITLITCVENQPEYRRCIQGVIIN